MNNLSIWLGISLLVCSGCYSDSRSVDDNTGEQFPQDFSAFYDRFHADTAFQLEHIAFPLEGLRAFSAMDSSQRNTPWTREEWVYHSEIDSREAYDITYDILSDEFVAETIVDTSGVYAMQRRFAFTSDGWKLIYYVEMQPASSPEN